MNALLHYSSDFFLLVLKLNNLSKDVPFHNIDFMQEKEAIHFKFILFQLQTVPKRHSRQCCAVSFAIANSEVKIFVFT